MEEDVVFQVSFRAGPNQHRFGVKASKTGRDGPLIAVTSTPSLKPTKTKSTIHLRKSPKGAAKADCDEALVTTVNTLTSDIETLIEQLRLLAQKLNQNPTYQNAKNRIAR